MKKTLAIVLVLLMAVSLFACGTKTPGASTAPSAAPTSAAPATNAPPVSPEATQSNTGKYGDDPLDKVGFFDPDYDYSKNERYTIQYMTGATGPLYDQSSAAFALWCEKMNCDYSPMWSSGNDNDAFLTNLQTFINQGVDGFIFDPDVNSYMRIQEICDEAGVSWMGFMSPAQNMEAEGTPLIHPFVGFDHYWFGQQMGLKMDEWMKTKWADVPKEEIGYISVDYSMADVLHWRTTGAQDAFLEKNPDMANQFFIADTVTTGPTLDGANTVVTAVLSEQTTYTHWLVSVLFDDIAMGSAAALDSMGFDPDTAVVTTIGGTSLQNQWDNGIDDCWQLAIFTPQTIYAEAVVGAVYAFMTGQATPETIWPSWVNENDPKSAGYAGMLLPSYWMTRENYQQLLEWSDVYAGAEEYDYDATGITRETYNARMDIPESYHK
ncbi:MAG: substrate-binding domain-containing protein [Clostridiales bacterium]|nr:substrate-binding domain-containing protein [Clostridiales bacterium]